MQLPVIRVTAPTPRCRRSSSLAGTREVEMMRRMMLGAMVLAAAGCGFSPTSPSEDVDAKGTRLVGTFNAGVSSQANEIHASATAAATAQGVQVTVKERPSLTATVAGGRFALEGLPAGAWSLVFVRDG